MNHSIVSVEYESETSETINCTMSCPDYTIQLLAKSMSQHRALVYAIALIIHHTGYLRSKQP